MNAVDTNHPRSNVIPPEVTDPKERARILKEMAKLAHGNPMPANAPLKFTRDELHERR